MKPILYIFGFGLMIALGSCESDSMTGFGDRSDGVGTEFSGDAEGESGSEGSGPDPDSSGLITAGEWKDLRNWTFWLDLLEKEDFKSFADYWSMYTHRRVSIHVHTDDVPHPDLPIELRNGNQVVWQSRTNNRGAAELFVSPFHAQTDGSEWSVWISGEEVIQVDSFYEGEPLRIALDSDPAVPTKVDIMFIVDATGSMGDELEFLKDDLQSIIAKIQSDQGSQNVRTGAVFYRDVNDDYITRSSDLTTDLTSTVNFVRTQSAQGGGDYPEAVHSALNDAMALSWSSSARARLAFLILDAPPHYESDVISDLQSACKEMAQRGITLIPISASGIDKNTEFLLRKMAILTNGTYVFITNHSGIGNDHIEASVGEYEVEYLNELVVRLIREYTE